MDNKIRGGLFGVFVGDALGVTYEFLPSKKISYKKLEILGGGHFNLCAGQISDDSEMTILSLILISDFIGLSYENIKKDYQSKMVNMYRLWYSTNPPDIGNTIRKAISTPDVINVAQKYNSNSQSNGVLMRIYPLAMMCTISNYDINQIKELTKLECNITHPNELVHELTIIYCYLVKLVLENYALPFIKDKLLNVTTNPTALEFINSSFKKPEPIKLGTKKIMTDDSTYMGYIGVAFQNTLYELFNGYSYDSSISSIIKRGGDTDTNAAIAGAILGAYYGYNNINKKWINDLKMSEYRRIEDYPFLSINNAKKILDEIIKKIKN